MINLTDIKDIGFEGSLALFFNKLNLNSINPNGVTKTEKNGKLLDLRLQFSEESVLEVIDAEISFENIPSECVTENEGVYTVTFNNELLSEDYQVEGSCVMDMQNFYLVIPKVRLDIDQVKEVVDTGQPILVSFNLMLQPEDNVAELVLKEG